MESAELFPAPLAKAGIEVLVPDAAGRAAIQRHTFDELVREVVTDEAISRFRRESEALIGRLEQSNLHKSIHQAVRI